MKKQLGLNTSISRLIRGSTRLIYPALYLLLIISIPGTSAAKISCGNNNDPLARANAEPLANPSRLLIADQFRQAIKPWKATGKENVDGWVPMRFKFTPPRDFARLRFILAIQPIGQLVETDSFYCLDSKGKNVALYTELEKFKVGLTDTLEFDVLEEEYPTIFERVRQGELHCVLQDDTALFSAHLEFYPVDIYDYYKRIIVDEDTNFAFKDKDRTLSGYPSQCGRAVADAFIRLMQKDIDVPRKLKDVLGQTLYGHPGYGIQVTENLGKGLGDKNHPLVRFFRHSYRVDAGKDHQMYKELGIWADWGKVGLVLLSPELAALDSAYGLITSIQNHLAAKGDEVRRAQVKLLYTLFPATNEAELAMKIMAERLIFGMKEKPEFHYWDVDLPERENFLELGSKEKQYRSKFERLLLEEAANRTLYSKMEGFTKWVEQHYSGIPKGKWVHFAQHPPGTWSAGQTRDIKLAAAIALPHYHDLDSGFQLFYIKGRSWEAKRPLKEIMKARMDENSKKLQQARNRYFTARFLLGYKETHSIAKGGKR